MIRRDGFWQLVPVGMVLLIGAVLLTGGQEVQAAWKSVSRLLSANSVSVSPPGIRGPMQLEPAAFLPIVVTNCIPDPPGDADNIDDALIVCSGQSVPGQVGDDDWDDVFKIWANANQQLTVSLDGSGGDADLYLYAPDATDVNTDDYVDSSTEIGNDEFIERTVLEDGYWYMDVNSFEGTTNYVMTVTLSGP